MTGVQTCALPILDGKFVDNTTVGIKELDKLPKDMIIEYHLMVSNPDRKSVV